MCHAVKADIDFADFTGGRLFIQLAIEKITFTHPGGCVAQLFEGLVNEPGNHGRAGKRQHHGHHQPQQPGFFFGQDGRGALLQQQPMGSVVNVKADPGSGLSVHIAGQNGFWA